MEYIGIGIVIAVAIAAGIIIYTKFKKCEDIPSGDQEAKLCNPVASYFANTELTTAEPYSAATLEAAFSMFVSHIIRSE